MGGHAFASRVPPIKTPRMSQEVYEKALEQSQAILRKFYYKVASAIEGPGKTTYGDVDIVVALPLEDSSFSTRELVTDRLEQALNAIDKKFLDHHIITFAVPWPHVSTVGASGVGTGVEALAESTNTASEKWYVQVDVHICKDKHEFDWELFHSAHGDLWNILGTMIRRFGLTVNNHALFLRIPEIEHFNRKKSMVFLTDDPAKILDFLGLDQEKWWKRFSTPQEMFEYAATCRMFWVPDIVKDEEGGGIVVIDVEGDVEVEKDQKSGTEGRKKLKHNERQRMAKRPIFQAWFDEFIPRCREEGKFGDVELTREGIRAEVFEKFGVDVEEVYNTRLHDWRFAQHLVELVNNGIKGNIPLEGVDGQMRSAAVKVLKDIIIKGELYNGSVPEAAKKDENGFYDLEMVKRFVAENWMDAGRIGIAKQNSEPRKGPMHAKAEERAQKN